MTCLVWRNKDKICHSNDKLAGFLTWRRTFLQMQTSDSEFLWLDTCNHLYFSKDIQVEVSQYIFSFEFNLFTASNVSENHWRLQRIRRIDLLVYLSWTHTQKNNIHSFQVVSRDRREVQCTNQRTSPITHGPIFYYYVDFSTLRVFTFIQWFIVECRIYVEFGWLDLS